MLTGHFAHCPMRKLHFYLKEGAKHTLWLLQWSYFFIYMYIHVQSNLVTMPPRYYATLAIVPLLLGPDKIQYKINLLCHPLLSLLCLYYVTI